MSLTLALLLLAAPGQAVWVVDGPDKTLTSAQRLGAFHSAVDSSFPTIDVDNLTRYYCNAAPTDIGSDNKRAISLGAIASSMKWSCVATDSNPTESDDEVFDSGIEPGLCKVTDLPDGTSERECRKGAMSVDAVVLHRILMQDVFVINLNRTWEFECLPDDAVPTDVVCSMQWISTGPSSGWRADSRAGKAHQKIGRLGP